jgi:small-conductance mechanosensitive channel
MATGTDTPVGAPGKSDVPGDPSLVDEPAEQVVQQALEQATRGAPRGEPTPRARLLPKVWLVAYVALFAGLAVAYPLIGSGAFGVPREWIGGVRAVAYVALVSLVVRAVTTAVEVLLVERLEDAVARYNLVKVVHLVGWLAIAFVALTQLAADWYAAAASVGLVSLILGLALQEPISSFFAWIYILLRGPYRVGDRIQIGEVTGDVINVGYLDTTVWEVGGPYLSSDHPSGRLVKFPNSRVFESPVFNYSWPLFPYIWSEIKLHIAYDSDLDFVARTMQEVVAEELGEVMMQRVGRFRELLAQTPVDELNVRERPAVTFRVSENTWLEAIVRYVVNPKESGRVRAPLLPKLLARLNAEPDRVRFPKSNMR